MNSALGSFRSLDSMPRDATRGRESQFDATLLRVTTTVEFLQLLKKKEKDNIYEELFVCVQEFELMFLCILRDYQTCPFSCKVVSCQWNYMKNFAHFYSVL